MLGFLVVALFIWRSVTALGLCARLAWGVVKVLGLLLTIAALPVLIVCFLCAGGFVLLLPLLLVAAACGLLKSAA